MTDDYIQTDGHMDTQQENTTQPLPWQGEKSILSHNAPYKNINTKTDQPFQSLTTWIKIKCSYFLTLIILETKISRKPFTYFFFFFLLFHINRAWYTTQITSIFKGESRIYFQRKLYLIVKQKTILNELPPLKGINSTWGSFSIKLFIWTFVYTQAISRKKKSHHMWRKQS